ncbi:MAG: hypothetical protein COA69_02070 [Robiginitomaculum sp.]|nr:MAG: hypothetical protein COA69_02070 [Robiginitomaculum sp.]
MFLMMKNAMMTVCAAALLGGCVTPIGGGKEAGNVVRGNTLSPKALLFGDYLAASYANNIGDAHERARYYTHAFSLKPQDLTLGRRAMVSSLTAGETEQAHDLAIQVRKLNEHDGLSRAILGAHALSKSEYNEALLYLGGVGDGSGLDDINALIRGWVQVGLGQQDTALETFTQLVGGQYFELMGDLQKAKLYAELGDVEAADKIFTEFDEFGISPIESVLSQVRFHMARGEKDEALTRLDVYAARYGGALTGPVRLYMDTINAGEQISTELSPAQSASRALTEPALDFYARQKQFEAAEMFLRLALELDPENDKARLFLGSVLEDVDRKQDALNLYMRIPADSPYTVSARLSEANLMFEKDENDAAIKTLESVHASHPSRITQDALGRAYLILADYEQALPYYEALIAEMSDEELAQNPQPRYLRGICLERLDRWQEAVEEFEYVLEHQPENADALNYLGYTWVDKGVELTKAFDMIRLAVELDPNSGAIVDSLGWAHYKLGQYEDALVQLENAVERSPSSATIVDHLGDVYWKLGRIREAGYQWRRARDLDPTEKELKEIKAKLESGLSASESVE